MDERQFADRLLPRLLEVDAQPPDPNLVAAYVAGTLDAETRRRVARSIEVDPESMFLVRALRADRRRTNVRRALFSIAAVALAAVGLGIAMRGRESRLDSVDDRLVAAVASLRERAPDLFGTFALLSAESSPLGPAVVRGGGAITWPVGVMLAQPSEVRWRAAAGATRVHVTVLGTGFEWSVDADGDRHALPRLAPGRYVVSLRALDALAGQESRGTFVVASELESARHRRAYEAIAANASPELRALLEAHYAARQGLYAEAKRAATEAAARAEVRREARVLLAYVESLAPGAP